MKDQKLNPRAKQWIEKIRGDVDEKTKVHEILFGTTVVLTFKGGPDYYAPLHKVLFGESDVFPVERNKDKAFRIYLQGDGSAPELKTETVSWAREYQQEGELEPDKIRADYREAVIAELPPIGVTKDRIRKYNEKRFKHIYKYLDQKEEKEERKEEMARVVKVDLEKEWRKKYGFNSI